MSFGVVSEACRFGLACEFGLVGEAGWFGLAGELTSTAAVQLLLV
jgi:hypothetical protein